MSASEETAWPIIKECLEGNLSLRVTIDALEARGVHPPGANRRYKDGRRPRWSAAAVRRIIKRQGELPGPVCAGCRRWESRHQEAEERIADLMAELDRCRQEAARPIVDLTAELDQCRDHVQRLKDELDYEQGFR